MIDHAGKGSLSALPLWAKVAMAASLALNLFTVGLFLGERFFGDPSRGGAEGQIRIVLTLTPEPRRDFAEQYFEPIRTEIATLRDARRDQLQEIVETIRMQPYSAERFQAAAARQRDSTFMRRKLVQDRLATLLAEFSENERMEFASKLEALIGGS
ncbi:MAG: periplasmic heavy metal sensor [Pseudomonadota bacterium]